MRCHIVLKNGKRIDICCVRVGMVLVEITRHWIRYLNICLENVNGHSRVAGYYIILSELNCLICLPIL